MAEGDSADEKVSCVLDEKDETIHPSQVVTLEVEGRQLHANRAVLAHFSPVFKAMLCDADFKEKSQDVVPLPNKKYKDLAVFFNVLLTDNSSTESQITDDNLSTLMGLADEYQVDHVKFMCQTYIWNQTSAFFFNFYKYYTTINVGQIGSKSPISAGSTCGQICKYGELMNKMMLYFHMCDVYGLERQKNTIKQLFSALSKNGGRNAILQCKNYAAVPADTKNQLLEALLY